MSARPTNVRYVVLFGLCLAAALAYIHRGCLSVVEKTARGEMGLTTGESAWALSAFFWAYALFQIPTGLLVDAWGPRRSLCLFGVLGAITVAMAAGTMWVNAATGFVLLLVSRVLMGIAQAGLFPASTRAMSVWIPLRRRAFAAGVLQAAMYFGGAIGAFTTARLLGIIHWPWVFALYAVPGLAWSFWFFDWFRDRPGDHRRTNAAERELLWTDPKVTAAADRWGTVFADFSVIFLCAQQFFRAAAAVFWMSWCPTYLQEVHGLDPIEAGSITSLPILGIVTGSILGGLIADRVFARTGSRRASRGGVSAAGAVVGVVIFGLAYLVPSGQAHLAIAVLTLASVAASFGNSCGYSVAMDLGGKNLAAVFGAMNMFGNFGAALFPLAIPVWVRWFDWPAAILLTALGYLLGALCWWPIHPDREPDPQAADYDDRQAR